MKRQKLTIDQRGWYKELLELLEAAGVGDAQALALRLAEQNFSPDVLVPDDAETVMMILKDVGILMGDVARIIKYLRRNARHDVVDVDDGATRA